MSTPYTLFKEIAEQVETPADGTLSRTIYQDDTLKVVLFGFSRGQELSEHTSTRPAIMHFLSGEADVTLGPDLVTAEAGTWIRMPPQLPHSVRTKTPVVMLLLMLKAPDAASS